MHFTITTKLFHMSEGEERIIEKQIKKLVQFVPWKDPDYPILDIILRKHKKRLHQLGKRPEEHLKNHETVDNPNYYDGTVDLILPKKRLFAKMLGKTVPEAIKDGFDELFRELNTYKGLHFPNDSEYDSHKPIR